MKRQQLALVLAVMAAGSLTGGLLGPRLDAAADRPNDRLKTFSQILGIIQDQYVEEVSPEVTIEVDNEASGRATLVEVRWRIVPSSSPSTSGSSHPLSQRSRIPGHERGAARQL